MTSGVSATNSVREFTIKRGIASCPANFNPHVLTFGPTEFLKALPERCYSAPPFRVIRTALMSTPIRAIGPRCCAHAAIGHMTVVQLRSLMNSRRLIATPEAEDEPS